MLSFIEAYMVRRPYLFPIFQALWNDEESLIRQLNIYLGNKCSDYHLVKYINKALKGNMFSPFKKEVIFWCV